MIMVTLATISAWGIAEIRLGCWGEKDGALRSWPGGTRGRRAQGRRGRVDRSTAPARCDTPTSSTAIRGTARAHVNTCALLQR
eukprot:1448606-Rhodomonas_salina.4